MVDVHKIEVSLVLSAVQSGIIHFTLKPTWVSNKVPVAANLSGVLPAVQQASSHL